MEYILALHIFLIALIPQPRMNSFTGLVIDIERIPCIICFDVRYIKAGKIQHWRAVEFRRRVPVNSNIIYSPLTTGAP